MLAPHPLGLLGTASHRERGFSLEPRSLFFCHPTLAMQRRLFDTKLDHARHLFPFNGGRRFTANIVNNSIHALYFVDYSRGDASQQVVW